MISLKPSCSLAEQVLLRHEHVVEGDRAPVSEACQPSFSSFDATSTPSPRSTIRKEMPWWPPSCVVLTAVTMKCARTPLVMYVFSPLSTQPPSTRSARVLSAGDVRAGARLGDAERADLLAGDRGHEVALLLLLGAELPDRRRGDVRVRAEPGGGAARAACAPAPRTAPPRAGSRRPGRRTRSGTSARAGPARPASAKTSSGNQRSSSHCVRVRRQLALDEAADRRAQLLVLVGERGIGVGHARIEQLPPAHARSAGGLSARCRQCVRSTSTALARDQRSYSPYERPITSSMISSVPAPMRFRRMSRHTRSTPYSFM